METKTAGKPAVKTPAKTQTVESLTLKAADLKAERIALEAECKKIAAAWKANQTRRREISAECKAIWNEISGMKAKAKAKPKPTVKAKKKA